jgi:HD superfamily phosphodiesterase
VDTLSAMETVSVDWAWLVAKAELGVALPRRWAHSQEVAVRASEIGRVLNNAELLQAAGVLHDVGCAPRIAATGFHPLDGARFLRDEHGADERLVRLVASHSFAMAAA